MTDGQQTESQLFHGGEFVVTSSVGSDGNTQFIGGGYKINLMNNGMSPLTTLSNSKSDGLSGLFENLAIPSGLYYSYKKTPNELMGHSYEPHNVLSDDIFDKLLGLVEYDKKRKRKTRKQDGGQQKTKRNTRKRHN